MNKLISLKRQLALALNARRVNGRPDRRLQERVEELEKLVRESEQKQK